MSQRLTLIDLTGDTCRPLSGAGHDIDAEQLAELLALLPGWYHDDKTIAKAFAFDNYEETLAFVNSVARIAHAQDHHPDIAFGYNHCRVAYTTHSVGGLSLNDFICAAKIEALPRP